MRLKDLACTCKECMNDYRALGIEIEDMPSADPKYAIYVIDHIIKLLQTLVNLNNPRDATPFLRLYARWRAAELANKKPGFT